MTGDEDPHSQNISQAGQWEILRIAQIPETVLFRYRDFFQLRRQKIHRPGDIHLIDILGTEIKLTNPCQQFRFKLG